MSLEKKTRTKQVKSTSWKKGQSGNPKGRPSKGYSIAERMREMFTEKPHVKDLIIQSMVNAVLEKGDVQAAKYLSSYLDGLPKQFEETPDDQLEKENFITEIADVIKKYK